MKIKVAGIGDLTLNASNPTGTMKVAHREDGAYTYRDDSPGIYYKWNNYGRVVQRDFHSDTAPRIQTANYFEGMESTVGTERNGYRNNTG